MSTTSSQNYTVEDLSTSLRFILPYRKLWLRVFVITFLLLSIPIAFLFLRIFIREKIDLTAISPLPVIILDITFWLAYILLLLIELLWLVIGWEVVEVDNNHIVIMHQIMKLNISRKLYSDKIDGVFVSRQKNDWLTYAERGIRFADFNKGLVAINYGKSFLGSPKTFRFGSNLDEREAKQIVNIIHQRFPQYIYKRSAITG